MKKKLYYFAGAVALGYLIADSIRDKKPFAKAYAKGVELASKP